MSQVEIAEDSIISEHKPKKKNGTSMMDVLRGRDFRLLWIGDGISVLGDQFYLIAVPWLILQITGSGLALGLMLMLAGIPRAILMLVGGALSDRFSPRKILLVSHGIRALLVGLLTVLVVTETVQLWHLYVLSFIFGVVDAFGYPAFSSMVPRLLDRDQLESGNALLQITMRMSIFIGPVLAGVVVATLGTTAALAIDTATFVFVMLMLFLMNDVKLKIPPKAEDDESDTQTESGILASIREGLVYVWNAPVLPIVLFMIAAVDFAAAGSIGVGLPVLAESRFGDANALGIMLSAFGGGSLLGLVIGGTVRFQRLGLLFIGLMLGFALSFALLGFATSVIFAAGLMAIAGAISGIYNVVGLSWIQKRIDPAVMGRVMSLIMFSSVGVQPLSSAIAGLLVDVNLTAMFVAAGGVIVIAALFVLSKREMRELRQTA